MNKKGRKSKNLKASCADNMLITKKTTNYIQHNGLALVLDCTNSAPLSNCVLSNSVLTAFPNTGMY